MQEITIDEEFKGLLPQLDAETYSLLEENILQNGCRDAVVLWNGILIDGHNRYAICRKHGIPFLTIEKEFDSREDVLIWIVSTQISRRNLSPIQLSFYRGLHYRADKEIVSNKQGKNQYSEVVLHSEEQQKQRSTVTRLAEKYKVSKSTIERDRDASIAIDAIGEASPIAKEMILSGEVVIGKKALRALLSASEGEIETIAKQIENGTYERYKPAASTQSTWSGTAGANQVNTSSMNPFEAAIAKITDELFSELRKGSFGSDAGELKATLRSYIAKLEELYNQL